jgi:RNA:NAD 2'-phosphotransferase (TPT1/KptA family)
MKAKQYLYHRTQKELVPTILKEGLKRKGFAVYLSESPFSWLGLGTATLRVEVDKIPRENEMTTFIPELDEVLVWGNIPPSAIEVFGDEEKGE